MQLKTFTVAQFKTREGIAEALDDASRFVDTAHKAGRSLTATERAQVEQVIEHVKDAQDNLSISDQIDAMRAPGMKSGGFGLGTAVAGSSFHVKANPSVMLSPGFLMKAPTFPAQTAINPSHPPTFVELGRDSRWLYPSLPREAIGDALSIQDFKQTVRTVTGTVERAATASTDKATLDVTLTAVNEAVKQAAVLIPGVPLAIFESMDGLPQYLNAEGTFQVEKAIDAHVFAQIVAAAPAFGNTGAGLIAQIRNAVAAMRANGANPDVLVLNATDAASLDLSTDAGGYVFPSRDSGVSSPLWGLKIVERTSAAGTEPPYLIDSQMLGRLYLGDLRFDADPFNGVLGNNFKQNLVDLRIEANCLFHVRNVQGAYRVAAI